MHHLTMDDIGLGHIQTLSPVAVTDPFPLLTLEGVKEIREEIFSKPVVDNFFVAHELSKAQLRGMAPSPAKFTADLWTHPETIKACSEAAGMELVPIMPYELGHVNIQVNDGPEGLEGLGRDPLPALPALVSSQQDGESSDEEDLDEDLVVGWHQDSYPWVCVVMLSDASTMKGGDTAMECGDGTIRKVRGPQIGWAVMMQGKYINHMAMKAWNANERVTMVTSFRAKDSSLPDHSTLLTIRVCSDVNDVYHQWASYRLQLLSERFQMKQEELIRRKDEAGPQKAGKYNDILGKEEFKTWVRGQIEYLQATINEIV